jgi:hypothetical protein
MSRCLEPIARPSGLPGAPANRANEPNPARMADERGDREVQNRANEPTEADEEGENRANEPTALGFAAGNRANEPNRAIDFGAEGRRSGEKARIVTSGGNLLQVVGYTGSAERAGNIG